MAYVGIDGPKKQRQRYLLTATVIRDLEGSQCRKLLKRRTYRSILRRNP
jgi:hypothetical protein